MLGDDKTHGLWRSLDIILPSKIEGIYTFNAIGQLISKYRFDAIVSVLFSQSALCTKYLKKNTLIGCS